MPFDVFNVNILESHKDISILEVLQKYSSVNFDERNVHKVAYHHYTLGIECENHVNWVKTT